MSQPIGTSLDNREGGRVSPNSIGSRPTLACGEAERAWRSHQADRAWIEWGICWPPFSFRRPHCRACNAQWPCAEALAAHAHTRTCNRHGP